MHYRTLGRTNIKVSLYGLGTMTWGEQNTEAEAHAQLDLALARGVNLIDAAEMYPVPPRPETQGRTETYIGTWLKKSGRRADVVLATKIVGRQRQAHQPGHIRGGTTRHDAKNIALALEESLRRLQTDYIDLYQLHWPDRTTNTFGRREYPWPPDDEQHVPVLETLEALATHVRSGKIRHIGVSNETPWGVAQFLRYSDQLGLPRIASIQNSFSVLNRVFEVGLAEFAHREQVGLLAYSPLAAGVLTGKYLNGARPPGARMTLFERWSHFNRASVQAAVAAYVELAREHGRTPAQLALGYVAARPFVTSVLGGATSVAQLTENLSSLDAPLSPETLDAVEAIHARFPNP
ncbi:MAG: NADP(H)-dependent aldo-keto reductase [Verrucomicrobia bacterium]|nr:NADP(H)-dependent aldo-keto reductase [Verrucomicrobiota bacterium]